MVFVSYQFRLVGFFKLSNKGWQGSGIYNVTKNMVPDTNILNKSIKTQHVQLKCVRSLNRAPFLMHLAVVYEVRSNSWIHFAEIDGHGLTGNGKYGEKI